MRLKTFALGLIASTAVLGGAARAETVNITYSLVNDDARYYAVNYDFVLPTGFSNATLTSSSFSADDRAVAQLNGVTFTNTGIGGPGQGAFSFDGATFVPYTFTNGNGADTDTVSTGFVAGTNRLTFIVNNTYSGIYGDNFAGGPSSVDYAGVLTYDLSGAVPEPAAWAMMVIGVGSVGATLRRAGRRSEARFTEKVRRAALGG